MPVKEKHLCILLLISLSSLPCTVGCKKNVDANHSKAPLKTKLKNIQISDAPFIMQAPTDWEILRVDPPPVPKKPAQDKTAPVIRLTGRLIFAAKGEAKNRVPPRIEIFHDPWFPDGTTASDYLQAQRESNEKAIRQGREGTESIIRHVEAERSRRSGRPTYHVRDEWDFSIGKEQTTISQESLLLIDVQDDFLHGYTVVLTMLKDDLPRLKPVISKMFSSLEFKKE